MMLMHNTNNTCAYFVDLEGQYKSLLKLVCNMTPWLTETMNLKDESSKLASEVNNFLLNQIGRNGCNFCGKKTSIEGKR